MYKYGTIAKVLVWRDGVRYLSHLLLTNNNDFQVDLSDDCIFNRFTVLSVLTITRVNSLEDIYEYCKSMDIDLPESRVTKEGLLAGVHNNFLIDHHLDGYWHHNNNSMFDEIANFIIKKVQNDSTLSGFQYLISFDEIEEEFGINMEPNYIDCILQFLCDKDEVADVDFYRDNFDITLYTDFASNYFEEDYCEDLEEVLI